MWFVLFLAAFQADSNTVLRDGLPVQVRVTADSPTLLVYQARAGEVINVTTRALSDSLDTTLELYDTDGQRLAFSDDLADSTDAALLRVRLDHDGLYTLALDSFNGVSDGDVEVLLRVVDAADARTHTDSDRTVITLDLLRGDVFTLGLAAFDGQTVRITARDPRGLLDPVLTLYDADGTIHIRNDDHARIDLSLGLFDARIESTRVDVGMRLTLHEALGRGGAFTLVIESAGQR